MLNRKTQRKPPVGTEPDALSYSCSVCGAAATLNARRCSHCEVQFAGVRCGYCEYVAPADWFPQHACPNCGVQPAPLAADIDESETCPSCGREMEPTTLHCHLCGWIDRSQVSWWLIAMVLALLALPAFAVGTDQGTISHVLKWTGLIGGAGIGFVTALSAARARCWPKRRLVSIGAILIWLVLIIEGLLPAIT